MRICLAIEKFDPAVGGAERYVWDLAHFLLRQGHAVEVICMRADTSAAPAIRVHRTRVLRFPQGLRHLSFALMHALKARTMRDAVHFGVGNTFFMQVYQPHGGLHRAWFGRETRRYAPALRPLVRATMRLSLKDLVQRGLEWWIFRITRPEVIAISEMVARDMQTFFGYPLEKIRLVPNGIDLARFTPTNAAARSQIRERYGLGEAFTFVFVAHNLALKGFEVLLEACRSLKGQAFKVLVIGPAGPREERQARDLDGHVVFGGRASDLELIYPACDCQVHPSFYDACSLVVLEALASGLPVITTGSNGAAMYLKGESSGTVVPAGDAGALAVAMQARMGHREGRQEAPTTFGDHEAAFRQVEAVIVACAGRGVRKGR